MSILSIDVYCLSRLTLRRVCFAQPEASWFLCAIGYTLSTRAVLPRIKKERDPVLHPTPTVPYLTNFSREGPVIPRASPPPSPERRSPLATSRVGLIERL
ncbi:hypothetical protein TgHK011_004403 [Trichoderma gracile]|nr:hypothetical protein TgHK011_004403 [Trichoderma gracile]